MSSSIQERVLLIRIPVLYEPGMAGVQLYEATRGVWRVGDRRESAEYGCAVVGGLIREVYVIDSRHPAGSTPYATRHQVAIAGRWEFLGRVAFRRRSEPVSRPFGEGLLRQGSSEPDHLRELLMALATDTNAASDLTPDQRRIVEWGDGPVVVIAGAGTGKTRVIVERVRWLLETKPDLLPSRSSS